MRGVAYQINFNPKAAIFVDSVETGGGSSASSRYSGGASSRQKLVRQSGQLRGRWQQRQAVQRSIPGARKGPTTYIAMLGGYDADFKTRNPWKHPTLLRTGADYKGHQRALCD